MSGGGDSIALLQVVADWARENGRRLLALTVDHGLSPASADWTAFAQRAARSAGADWRSLDWTGPKPSTGLPAAARRARHGLIADAAREAGARVVLFAHTADDIAEGELMRAEGSTLGRLRDWAPSPAWPEGRGLMLLRPMLGAGRAEVRDWLTTCGANWIDDPANEDPTYARSRARQSIRAGQDRAPAVEADADPSTDAATLAATIVCGGGGERPPRGDRLAGLLTRLRAGDSFAATLCGARIEADGGRVAITREPGELTRRPPPPLQLEPGVEAVWDGRWAIMADEPGWSVVPAAGRMAALSDADRAVLKTLPSAARAAEPVLIRNETGAPVLARTGARARSLVEQRLALTLDRMTHERDLGAVLHGETLRNPLFST